MCDLTETMQPKHTRFLWLLVIGFRLFPGEAFSFVATGLGGTTTPIRLPWNVQGRRSLLRNTRRHFPLGAGGPNDNGDGEAYQGNNRADDQDDDDDDDDDDEPPDVDIRQFRPPTASFGLNSGRSSPSQRKGMGLSRSSTAKVFLCTQCGSEFVKWMGRCPTCKSWNTLQEHVVMRQSTRDPGQPWFGDERNSGTASSHSTRSWLDSTHRQHLPTKIGDILRPDDDNRRRRQRIPVPNDDELNNVLGGGFFPGSLILVGGSPGVGKSTLLLQVAAEIAALATPTPGIGMGQPIHDDGNMYGPVWYVSGEETTEQIGERGQRLGLLQENTELYVWQETYVDDLCRRIVHAQSTSARDTDDTLPTNHHPPAPRLLIVDSIQTMVCDAGGSSAAGGVTQVRECVGLLLRLAKSTGIPVCLVGHVTKSGDVAGPKTVEHMVDCVLYLEGAVEGGLNQIRILRANKNRFGSSDEVGVYSMTSGRLMPVSDPSSLFLAHRSETMQDTEGCAVSVALEGRRAVTIEVQALVTMGTERFSRKTVDGIPLSRIQLLLGVLQKRCHLYFTRQDIYLNLVAGQIRLDRREANSVDLAVAVSLVSSLTQIPVRSDTAFCGEVGLLGELRPVPALEKRIKEAKRMGFGRVVTAREQGRLSGRNKQKSFSSTSKGIEWIQCASLMEAINHALVDPLPKKRPQKKRVSSVESLPPPASVEDLGLDPIMDDDDDDDNDDFVT